MDNRLIAISSQSFGSSARGGASLEGNCEAGEQIITELTARRKCYREEYFDSGDTPAN